MLSGNGGGVPFYPRPHGDGNGFPNDMPDGWDGTPLWFPPYRSFQEDLERELLINFVGRPVNEITVNEIQRLIAARLGTTLVNVTVNEEDPTKIDVEVG